MMCWSLSSVVNLSQTAGRIKLDYVTRRGYVYAHSLNSNVQYGISLGTELVRMIKFEDEVDEGNVEKQRLLLDKGWEKIGHTKFRWKSEQCPYQIEQLVVNMLTHRVSGDKMTKGLRLMFPNFAKWNATVHECYLGGWYVESMEHQFSEELFTWFVANVFDSEATQ